MDSMFVNDEMRNPWAVVYRRVRLEDLFLPAFLILFGRLLYHFPFFMGWNGLT